jgi:hypothetical protein
MKKAMVYVLAAFGATSLLASAEPMKLDSMQLDRIVAGAISKTNGGGNTPQGNANGIPATNPAGHAPPGQNK